LRISARSGRRGLPPTRRPLANDSRRPGPRPRRLRDGGAAPARMRRSIMVIVRPSPRGRAPGPRASGPMAGALLLLFPALAWSTTGADAVDDYASTSLERLDRSVALI